MSDIEISSSKFGSAMGLNPWQSRQKLWGILTGRIEPDEINAAMQWGLDNEWRGVAAAEGVSGIFFQNTGDRQKQHNTVRDAGDPLGKYRMRSTPDGSSGRTGLEVKCPKKLYDEVPAHYMAQGQGQMHVCGFDTVIFGAWTPQETRVWSVPRSEDYITQQLQLLDDFMLFIHADEKPGRRAKPVMPEVPVTRIL